MKILKLLAFTCVLYCMLGLNGKKEYQLTRVAVENDLEGLPHENHDGSNEVFNTIHQ